MTMPVLLPFLRELLALHVIAVILWMAGMIVLPMIYLRHHGLEPASPAATAFVELERQIFKSLVNPAMYAAWGFGILLALTPGTISWSAPWWLVKLAAVLLLSWYHGILSACRRRLRDDARWEVTLPRWSVAIPIVLMVAIVTMVLVRP
jgi:putative membrane protein